MGLTRRIHKTSSKSHFHWGAVANTAMMYQNLFIQSFEQIGNIDHNQVNTCILIK